jgi:hypothetical protein
VQALVIEEREQQQAAVQRCVGVYTPGDSTCWDWAVEHLVRILHSSFICRDQQVIGDAAVVLLLLLLLLQDVRLSWRRPSSCSQLPAVQWLWRHTGGV